VSEKTYILEGYADCGASLTTRGPYATKGEVVAQVGELIEEFEAFCLFRVEDDGSRTLVMRYDVDGYDL
jgi:hypothetical protein